MIEARQLLTRAAIATFLSLFSFGIPHAAAQNYRFRVEELDLQAYVNPDASIRLEYRLVFNNAPNADPIDILDIGLPHSNYNLAQMSAAIDGQRLTTIRKSEYVDIGVEVPLIPPIPPGGRGTFTFTCTMPDMVYQDTTDKQLASLQIKPTWFDTALQTGSTHLRVAIHLPPEVLPEEIKYQQEKTKYHSLVLFGEGEAKHMVAVWEYPAHRLSEQNPKLGVSFPKGTMQRVVKMSAMGLLVKWFGENKHAQIYSGIALGVLFSVTFIRFSNGTGWILGLGALGMLIFTMVTSPGVHLSLWPPMIGLFGLNEWGLRKQSRRYLPAMATVEGGGIKRGLTAPQAAVLLELPLGKILTLVIFGLLKKGVIRIVDESPLRVEVVSKFRSTRDNRKRVAAKEGIVLHTYEQPFLDRIMAGSIPAAELDFRDAVSALIMVTVQRMKGFDLSDTREYYRRIVARAWTEAESIGEFPQRDQVVERNFDWMMLDPDYYDRFDTWSSRGYHYRPSWSHSSASGSPNMTGGRSSPTSSTSFGEVASSFAGWSENAAGQFASAIEPGSLGLKSGGGGILDLSGVDKVTADVFEALSEASQSSGGGGGGGGCACACAGCACACACAGGGR
ncbi:MAG: hypothetical protein H6822_17775 [Planctomycetaceae bacterium]|nr:hypothetical protein [Planctomycetales bacterium]MCB9924035.1 hypothetical protein [Planctomycetaceae bacterium]